MAPMKWERIFQIGLRLFAVVGMLATFCLVALAILLFGRMPLNQLNLWKLEQSFHRAASVHPQKSFLLEKKSYIGGPYDHGSATCGIFVGELRAAPLTKEEIIRAYAGRTVRSFFQWRRTPITALFFDEGEWPVILPLTEWWDAWRDNPLLATSSTVFFVYAARKDYPSWGDLRCDD